MTNKLRPSQLEVLYSGDLNGNEFFTLHRIGYNYSLTLGELKKYIGTGGSGGGSDIDLTSVPSNIIPDSNGSRILGNAENAWKRLFLTDSIVFSGGRGSINGDLNVIGALNVNGAAVAMQSSIDRINGIVGYMDVRLLKVEQGGAVVDLSDYYTKHDADNKFVNISVLNNYVSVRGDHIITGTHTYNDGKLKVGQYAFGAGSSGITIDGHVIKTSGNSYSNSDIDNMVASVSTVTQSWVQDNFLTKMTIDSTPTAGSSNLVTSGGVANLMAGKQDTISDLATIRSNADNGNTAFGWGDHNGKYASLAAFNGLNSVAITTGNYGSKIQVTSNMIANGAVDNTKLSNELLAMINSSVLPSFYDNFDSVLPTATEAYIGSHIYYLPPDAPTDLRVFYFKGSSSLNGGNGAFFAASWAQVYSAITGQSGYGSITAYYVWNGSDAYNNHTTLETVAYARKDVVFYNSQKATLHSFYNSDLRVVVNSGNISSYGFATQQWTDNRYLSKTGGTINGSLIINGFETNVTSYIGSADNTDYKALLLRRSGKGFRINMTSDRGYIAFGSLNNAKDELTSLNSIVTIGTDGLKYSPNDVNYYDILTSNSLKIGEYAFQDRTENRLKSTTDLNNVSYGVWGTLDNTTYTNAPVQNFGLIVSRLNQLYKGQLILPYSNGHLQYRAQAYNNGEIEWSGWRELAFTDDIPSISGKADKSGYTPNYLIGADANGNIQSTPYQTAKLSYISTLTSNAQDQLNALSSRVNILTAGGIQNGLYPFYKQLTDAEIGMAREVAELAGNPSSDQTVVFNYRQGYFQLANRVSTSTAFTVYKKWNGSDKYNRYTTNSNGSITATPREDTLFYNQSVGIQRVAVNSTNNGYVVNTIISEGEIPASFVNAMPLKTIDTTPTLNSSNLITSGGVAKQMAVMQDTISDLDTIRSNATNGNTAYGWGNHAIKGYATETYTINKINEIVAAKAGGIPSYVKELSGSGLSNITLVDGAVPPYDVTSASAIYYIVDKGCFYLVISPEAIGQAGRTTKAYPIFDGSAFYNSSATSARKDCLFYNTTTKTVHRIGDSSVLTMVDSGNISSYGFATQQWADSNYLSKTGGTLNGSLSINGLLNIGSNYIRGNGNHDILNSQGEWVILGYGIAGAGLPTYIDGNEIYFRYGTGHAQAVKIGSDGNTSVYGNLNVSGSAYISGYAYIGKADNTAYLPLVLRRLNHGLSLNNTADSGYIVFGELQSGGSSVKAEKVLRIGDSGLQYSSDGGATYVSVLTSAGGTVDHITTSMLNGYSLIGSSSGLTLSGYFSATRFYEDGTSLAEKYLSKSSDTVTGTLTFNGTSTYHLREASTTPKWYIGKDGYAAFAYVANTSDANMKNLMGDVNLSVNQIANAPARYFTWNNNIQLGRQVGTIAQYWKYVLPEVVIENEGTLGLNYATLAVVSSIILARNLETHEQRIARLEKEIATLTDELNSLVGKA